MGELPFSTDVLLLLKEYKALISLGKANTTLPQSKHHISLATLQQRYISRLLLFIHFYGHIWKKASAKMSHVHWLLPTD